MPNSKPNLTNTQRNQIALFLYQSCPEFSTVPAHGKIKEAVQLFGVSRRTVNVIWSKAKVQLMQGLPIFLTNAKVGVARAKRVHLDLDVLESIQLEDRTTFADLSKGLQVSKTTAWKWYRLGLIRSHTSEVHPELSEKCKFERLKFSLKALQFDIQTDVMSFKPMNHTVHIDEKWFYLTKAKKRYLMSMREADPYRAVASKHYIGKIMFLCDVCRPIYNTDGTLIFDGKIGIFPFTEMVSAKRKSKNRAAGTLQRKPITSVTRDVIKDCMINQVIPAIKAKWPLFASTDIFIQQDNAKPHVLDTDPSWRAAANSDGFTIHLVQQPPRSPDLNINDLGWFSTLQSQQIQCKGYNIDGVLNSVDKSFLELSDVKLNKVFLSLQNVMIEILKVRGHNNFKMSHMGKDRLIRQGILPENLTVDKELVKQCFIYLHQAGALGDMEEVMDGLGIGLHDLV